MSDDDSGTTRGVPGWTYRAPYRPEGYAHQCYYRAVRWLRIAHGADDRLEHAPALTLFRFDDEEAAQLKIDIEVASIKARLSTDALVALRDACNDALADIASAAAERERRESFERISEELRESELRGESPGVWYAHPDVHYVAPDQVQAKLAELSARGAAQYIVLPINPADGADDGRSTRHFPSLENADERAA